MSSLHLLLSFLLNLQHANHAHVLAIMLVCSIRILVKWSFCSLDYNCSSSFVLLLLIEFSESIKIAMYFKIGILSHQWSCNECTLYLPSFLVISLWMAFIESCVLLSMNNNSSIKVIIGGISKFPLFCKSIGVMKKYKDVAFQTCLTVWFFAHLPFKFQPFAFLNHWCILRKKRKLLIKIKLN